MPKEVITHAKSVDVVNGPPGSKDMNVITNPQLTLHWSSFKSTEDEYHGVVQLSVVTYPTVSKDEWREALSWPPPSESEVYSAVMSRDDINRLIRLLRRARDAAYGGDA